MQFELNEAASLLQTSTREFLENESPLEKSRPFTEETVDGFSREVYSKLAELGYLGLTLPEDRGGSGIGPIGMSVVLHEMGRVAFPGPFLEMVLSVETLSRIEHPEAGVLLEELLEGKRLVLLAREESVTDPQPAPPASRLSQERVRGTKRPLPYGASADVLLVTTVEGLVWVSRPDEGWGELALTTFDHTQRFAEIGLDHAARLLADGQATESILMDVDLRGSLGAAALLLGLMERSLELAVEYMKEREAFGRPIASFQALQHRAADMWMETESSRAAVYRAAWALENDDPDAPLLVAAAKAYSGDAARFVTGHTIQLFGGVGFTWEYAPHIFYKRVKTLEQMYGSTRTQLELALQARDL